MNPAAVDLCEILDDIEKTARHEPDPRVSIARFAAAFAAYLRTPD